MEEDNTTNQNTPSQPSGDAGQDNQANDLEQVKVMAALAYFGILFFLPLVTHPNSSFGKFHANQGLLLLIAGIAINFLWAIPILGWILIPFASIFVFVLFIMGIVNALGLKKKRLPLIGGFDIIK
jgi:uncharacterized membrane protein